MKICVIGLGYIGLPTAATMATSGYTVHGVEIRPEVVAKLRARQVHIQEPGLSTLVAAAIGSGSMTVDTKPVEADAFMIAVPTPFKHGEGDQHLADLSYVESAARAILPFLRKGNLVILESTSPPGTTRNVVAPILEESGLKAGVDFHVAYSPERVLPGAILREIISNDRVVGGLTPACAAKAKAVYSRFVEGGIFETDCTTAEMVKLSENTFRDVNIALANELARICEKVGADVWEVVRLANHHPRVNLHQPGPGVGGHCIAVDPWFLVEACPNDSELIHTARRVNDSQPHRVVATIERLMRDHGPGAVAFFGVTYKANVDDVRESPSREIVAHFAAKGTPIIVHDPKIEKYEFPLTHSLDEAIAKARYLVLLVNHREYDAINPAALAGKVVIDTRRMVNPAKLPADTIVYTLGRKGNA